MPEPSSPRMFGSHPKPALLPWAWAATRLAASANYWINSTRPDGRPHARPVWGVWLDDALYFSTGSLGVTNLLENPAITVHLESGDEVVIIEGTAAFEEDRAVVARVCDAYNAKYHWDMDPDALPGPFFVVTPTVVFGWVCDPTGYDRGALFGGTATRWRFDA